MRFPFCRNRDSLKNGTLISIRRTGDGFHPGLFKSTGMNRKEFCEYFGIPYRTVTEWERGTRKMPDYVFRLLAYRIKMEKFAGKEEVNEE